MKANIPTGKTRLLLVEGKIDIEFFVQLGFHLQFTKETPLQILEFEGKDNLDGFLEVVQTAPEFPYVTHVGIVRDSDFARDAFQKVQNAIANANRKNPDRNQYAMPTQPLTFEASDKMQVGVYIMPDAESDGMLESLILRVIEDDEIMACVENYFECVENTEMQVNIHAVPKAKMRVYMAALYQGKIRTFIEGKNVDFETLGKDREKSYLSDIYKMSWWSWEHEAFNDIKAFINKLIE